MNVEKREDGWYVGDQGPFPSRDIARENVKVIKQDEAEATYTENLAATEALDATEDTVTRETAQEVRARENFVVMALYGNTPEARAHWTRYAEARGYEVPASV